MGKMFAIGPEGQASLPGWVIPKTQKMVLDTSMLNTEHYRYVSRVKWSNSGEEVAIEKGAFWSPRLRSPTLLLYNNAWNNLTACKQRVIGNKIICIRSQYLKSFNSVQKIS